MKRRSFVAGSFLTLAAGACAKAALPQQPLTHLSSEQLLARAVENGKNGKLTAFHFWATWCGPCLEELPLLEQEWRGWIKDDKDLDFLGVDVDEPGLKTIAKSGMPAASKERDDSVAKFIAEQGTTFPMVIAAADDPEIFAYEIDPGWQAVLPTTMLFGLDGKLAHRNIGELRVSKFRDKVRDLLAGR